MVALALVALALFSRSDLISRSLGLGFPLAFPTGLFADIVHSLAWPRTLALAGVPVLACVACRHSTALARPLGIIYARLFGVNCRINKLPDTRVQLNGL